MDFKKIKSLFVVEEEKSASEPAPTAADKAAPAPAASPVAAPAEPGKVTDKFMQVLSDAMQQSNLQGLDYLEYKQSLNSLAKMPMDEPIRYQSAYAMAHAMGATSQKLVESAQHYLDVLKGEEAKFQDALRKQQTEQIGNREGTIKNLETTISQKAEQIKKLTQEIEQHRQQAESLKREIADASGKVAATKNNFEATYASLVAQIQADVENMKRYLK
ncbi:MAG: hypothetical protein AAB316_16615 [Bacteroidota bacterium]